MSTSGNPTSITDRTGLTAAEAQDSCIYENSAQRELAIGKSAAPAYAPNATERMEIAAFWISSAKKRGFSSGQEAPITGKSGR